MLLLLEMPDQGCKNLIRPLLDKKMACINCMTPNIWKPRLPGVERIDVVRYDTSTPP